MTTFIRTAMHLQTSTLAQDDHLLINSALNQLLNKFARVNAPPESLAQKARIFRAPAALDPAKPARHIRKTSGHAD